MDLHLRGVVALVAALLSQAAAVSQEYAYGKGCLVFLYFEVMVPVTGHVGTERRRRQLSDKF